MSPYVKEENKEILVLEIDDKNNSVCVCIQGHLDCIFESKYSSIKIFNWLNHSIWKDLLISYRVIVGMIEKKWEHVTQIHVYVHGGVGKFGPLRRLMHEGQGSQ